MVKTFIFGDSFSRMFTLVKNIKVYTFTGKTAKGIGKENDEDRIKINKIIKKNYIDCLVFNFGSVDVHHSYFYKLFNNEDNFNENEFIDSITTSYINYIKEIKNKNKNRNMKIYIICPYYSPIKEYNVYKSLINYNVIKDVYDDQYINKMKKYFVRKNRNRIVDLFNNKIKELIKNDNIEVIDINDKISKYGVIKKEYIDMNIYNIHLIWETLILQFIKIFSKCGIIKENINLSLYNDYYNEKKERYKLLNT